MGKAADGLKASLSSRSIRHFPTRFVVFFRHPKKAGAAYGTAGNEVKIDM